MTDVTWTIETADFGTLTASGVSADSLPTFLVGEEITLSFVFNTGLANHVEDYNALRQYGRFANDSTTDTGTDIRGKPWYREKPHPESNTSSAVVRLSPGPDVGLNDYWGLITGIEDNTRYVGAGERIDLTVFILAKGDSYTSRDALRDDLEAEL
jgi:hypothetical protein